MFLPIKRMARFTFKKIAKTILERYNENCLDIFQNPTIGSTPWVKEKANLVVEAIAHDNLNKISFSSPLIVTISVTNKCESNCATCYAAATPAGDRFIDFESLKLIAQSRAPYIGLTGGDPLLHPEINKIVEYFVNADKGVFIAVASNTRKARELAERYGKRITFLLSAFGDDLEGNDRLKFNGHHKTLMSLAQTIVASGGRIILNKVVSDMLPNEAVVDRSNINQNIILSSFHLIPTGRMKASACSTPPPREKAPKGWRLRMMESLYPELLGASCGANFWTMHVAADGTVHPCFAIINAGKKILLCEEGFDSSWNAVREHNGDINFQCVAE